MAKKSKRKKVSKKKTNYLPIVILVVIIIIAVLIISTMKPTVPGTNGATDGGQEQPGQQPQPSVLTGDICKRDSECFLANCRSNPNVVECVNSTHQELYYKQCKGLNDVRIAPQDFTRCGCISGICKIK